ncbi:MAG: universal stress protein [Thermoleophilia bacterium]
MTPRIKDIACFIDDSDAARRALDEAADLRAVTGGRLRVVHVIAPPAFLLSMAASLGGAPVHDPEIERQAAQMWLAEVARSIEGAEPVLLEGHPPSTACDWARESGCDLMVAATHRGRLERALLGSFAGFLAHHAPCPVLLVPPAPEQ